MKRKVSITLSRQLLNESVRSLEAKDYKSALKIIADIHQPLETARSSLKFYGGQDEYILDEIDDLQDSMIMIEAQAKCLKKLEEANNINIESLYEDENPDLDEIFKILDLYKEAILYSQGKDIETEGHAFSKIGKIFYLILKNIQKADQCFMHSINLALALHPKPIENEEWFKSAKKLLEKLHKDRQEAEDEKEKQDKEKLKEKYAEEIEEIETEGKKSVEQFLLFLYEKFKKPELEELKKSINECLDNMKKSLSNIKDKSEDSGTGNRKSILLKTIRVFHPDKLRDKEEKIKYLGETISRILTDKYTVLYKA